MDKNDLISRSALKDAFGADAGNTLQYINSAEYELIMLEVDEAPAIDPEKLRPKGKWVYNKDGVCQCSFCRNDAMTEGDYRQVPSNYCPNCGAYMREGDES